MTARAFRRRGHSGRVWFHFGMLHGIAFGDYDDSGNLSMFPSAAFTGELEKQASCTAINLGSGNRALEVRLVGTRSNRDAIGTRVIATVGSRRIYRWLNDGDGFGTLNSRIMHIGIGRNSKVELLQVDWPSGIRQSRRNISCGQRIEIVAGLSAIRTLARFRS